ncbi:MAG: hypothetical protein M1817_000988 [Caeruleum heppii]|nr:MAG: hypothetical protein M1817_000988 [Caeruleum heppii]
MATASDSGSEASDDPVSPYLDVVVVGGSLGGLFTGIVLRRLGHNVRIFERSPTPLLHDQGAGIVAGSELQAFFHNPQLNRVQRPFTVRSRLRQYLDVQGNVIHSEPTVQEMTSWDLVYHILKAGFFGVKSDYVQVPLVSEYDDVPPYLYGHTFETLRLGKDGRKVEIDFVDKEGKHGSTKADLVIAADGSSSTVRKIFQPDIERKYVGYVALRGTVPENHVSDQARDTFVEKFTFYHTEGIQILLYTIPGKNGELTPGSRLLNWVWYCNYPADSQSYRDLMTDKDGVHHHITLPIGSMRPEIWEERKAHANKVLPPQFAELVSKTKQPFVQSITDSISPQASYLDGKVLLIGDAVAGFRPHTAASTSQAAKNAMELERMMKGEMKREEWEAETMQYARSMSRHGIEMGDRSQFGHHPLAS